MTVVSVSGNSVVRSFIPASGASFLSVGAGAVAATTFGLHGGTYDPFVGRCDWTHPADELPTPEVIFQEDKDDALLPIENDIKEDCMFLSDDAAYEDDITIGLKNQAEILELQNRTERARQEQALLRNQMIKDEWGIIDEGLNVDISKKIQVFAQLEKFTGLTDLDNHDMKTLLGILNRVPPEDIKKNKRAADLVKKWLTPEEWKELLETSKVTIHSKKHKGRYYEISAQPSERVGIFEEKHGRWGVGINSKPVLIASACGVDSVYGMADGDKFLNKVIAIKEDEDGYLKRSNVSRYD